MKKPPRFLAAPHLGGLARWLRLLGYDCAVHRRARLHRLVAIAMRERRVYLTRSRAESRDARSFSRRLIVSERPEEQLAELRDMLTLDEARLFTRCSRCNTPLRALKPDRAAALAPPYIVATHPHINYCPDCGRLYWPGTHQQSMRNTLEKIFSASAPHC